MSNVTRTIQANLAVLQGDDNVRRSLSVLSFNWPTALNSVTKTAVNVAPGTSFVFNSAALDNAVTILATDHEVTVSFKRKSDPGVLITFTVASLLVIDESLLDITVVNNGESVATINFIQG